MDIDDHHRRIRRCHALAEEMETTARELAVLQARQLRQIAEYVQVAGGQEDAIDDVALILRMTMQTADRRYGLARALLDRLPGTLAAMEAGALDLPHAQAVADATAPLTPELARAVEARLLPGAVQQNPNELRRTAAKTVQQIDPHGAEARHQQRRQGRRVELWPAEDGMADLYAHLAAEDAVRIKVRLDAFAKAQPKSDPRTADQQRADILTDLLLSRSAGTITTHVRLTAPATILATDPTPTPTPARARRTRGPAGRPRTTTSNPATGPTGRLHTGRAPDNRPPRGSTPATTPGQPTATTHATTPAITGPATDHAAAIDEARRPAQPAADTHVPATATHPETAAAELAGYGVITASQARNLAAHDATWRRLLTDPLSGMLIDYGRTTYTPPAALSEFIRARDARCVFPGCAVPSERCDLDHRVPYPKGPTSVENLAPLCRHHHRIKHRNGWTVRRRADGAHVWTSPTEREYLNPPIPLTPPQQLPPPVEDEPPPF